MNLFHNRPGAAPSLPSISPPPKALHPWAMTSCAWWPSRRHLTPDLAWCPHDPLPCPLSPFFPSPLQHHHLPPDTQPEFNYYAIVREGGKGEERGGERKALVLNTAPTFMKQPCLEVIVEASLCGGKRGTSIEINSPKTRIETYKLTNTLIHWQVETNTGK